MENRRLKYTALVEPAAEGGYFVAVPVIGGQTRAWTYDEAIEAAQSLVNSYVDSAMQTGEPLAEEFAPTKAVTLEASLSIVS